MSTIQSPNNYHGILGRRIAKNLQSEVLCSDTDEGEFACDSDEESLKQEMNKLYIDVVQLLDQLRNKIQALQLSTEKCVKFN